MTQALRPHPQYKQSETDTHVFFLTGPFSNWHPSEFEARLPALGGRPESELMKFDCGEQYMMAGKAWLMGDTATLARIMGEDDDLKAAKDLWIAKGRPRHLFNAIPRRQKALGREVAPFNQALWEAHDEEIVFQGNLAKFSQNPDLANYLHATGDKVIVEGAGYDKIWGVGIYWDNPKIADPANWKGLNKLGKVHMRVRKALAA